MTNKEYRVTFDPTVEKERLPYSKFSESIWWRDCPENNNIIGQRTVINGEPTFAHEVHHFVF